MVANAKDEDIGICMFVLTTAYKGAMKSGIPLYEMELKKIAKNCTEKFKENAIVESVFEPLVKLIKVSDDAAAYTLLAEPTPAP
jgi:hypothetical protein